jgi:hypothetical protein
MSYAMRPFPPQIIPAFLTQSHAAAQVHLHHVFLNKLHFVASGDPRRGSREIDEWKTEPELRIGQSRINSLAI